MQLEDAAREYWDLSQFLRHLPTPADRETYILTVLAPRREKAVDHQYRLLSKLIEQAA